MKRRGGQEDPSRSCWDVRPSFVEDTVDARQTLRVDDLSSITLQDPVRSSWGRIHFAGHDLRESEPRCLQRHGNRGISNQWET